MEVTHDNLVPLQSRTDRIRNVCVLAHVDHGKTTLSDHLIASNGLIHPRLAGELRYMDSNEDEQARGITMKSSCISLLHSMRENDPAVNDEKSVDAYLFNLIDSPGHVDFCSEVSTAARLSDGGFVLVDAVEGVCIQTHAVLRQAWEEKLEMCLVINKIDRLILELDLDPSEAYQRIVSIVGNVNMVLSSFESERFISEADAFLDYQESEEQSHQVTRLNGEDSEDYFSPARGNVAFGSAFDGWAFTVHQFARMYAKKLQCKEGPLHTALWGNFYFEPKAKRIMPIKREDSSKFSPLFVSWILEPIWKAYNSFKYGEGHVDILEGIAKKLSLGAAVGKGVTHQDPRVALRALMRGWLPLSNAVLGMGVLFLPDPRVAAPNRMSRFLPKASHGGADDVDIESWLAAETAIRSCDASEDSPMVVFVSKMISVPVTSLPRSSRNVSISYDSKEECFLAFGRVFSGMVRQGQEVYVVHADGSRVSITVSDLYMMMGRGLESLETVPAGNILALRGLETAILKSATLSSVPSCRPFLPLQFQAAPIVQVAVEPAHPNDMDALERGLQLLHRADPLVSVSLQESGEHVVSAAGEIHLETCIKDLKERFARIELVVSPPLVRFKESIAVTGGAGIKTVEAQTAGKGCRMQIRVTALADSIAAEIEGLETAELKLQSNLDELCQCLGKEMPAGTDKRIWQLGPKRIGPNLLLASKGTWNREWRHVNLSEVQSENEDGDSTSLLEIPIPLGTPDASNVIGLAETSDASQPELEESAIRTLLLNHGLLQDEQTPEVQQETVESTVSAIRAVVSGISTGFQMATASGPLCGEPLRGVLVEIEAALAFHGDPLVPFTREDIFGPFSGQVSATVRQAIRKAVLDNGPRIVEAYFLCEISTSSEGLSAVYAVLGRRRARILREELKEGSGLFVVMAHLPVEASFGFADELRRKSSGSAAASLMFSHWERLNVDPFFQPLTEEEREEFGEEGQGVGKANLAKKLIDDVRRRKGLQVEEKVVESGTKQRTRARKV